MKYPALKMDTKVIRDNALVISKMLRTQGIRLVGVAKSTACHPAVVRALLSGGASAMGDSRVENLARVREAGYRGETILLRAPSWSRCQETVEVADISLNSDVGTVHRLGEAALALGKSHKVVLMVDMGDLREGVLLNDALSVARQMAGVPGIRLAGVGTNWGCYGGVMPSRALLEALVSLKGDIERTLGIGLDIVSGGNSTNINMLLDRSLPKGVTELRLGESILLGTEATQRRPVPGCRQDAFTLMAEVIEVLAKPSKPMGQIGQNAFGVVPEFPDRGIRRRAICSVGRQDIDPDGLVPLDPGVSILGASSDHLILDVEEAGSALGVGSVLSFRPNYSALLRASTSAFVEKVVVSQ